MHTFDAPDNGNPSVWDGCPEEAWCYPYSDRLSASVVNRQIPSFFWGAEQHSRYHEAMGGFVLDPGALMPSNRTINCAWGSDAGTMGMLCEPLGRSEDGSCIPGCRSSFQCGTRPNMGGYCWHPPNQIDRMLAEHMARDRDAAGGCYQADCDYNEVVLDFDAWASTLPHGVQAIFFWTPRSSRDYGCNPGTSLFNSNPR